MNSAVPVAIDFFGIRVVSRNHPWKASPAQHALRRTLKSPVPRALPRPYLFESTLDGVGVIGSGRQLAAGIDYWFEPSLVLKAEYLLNDAQDDLDTSRIAVQLAFGF
jgi:hypothetical protein